MLVLRVFRYKWKKIVLLYYKSDQDEIGGGSACYLSMTNVISELFLIPNLDYVDGDIGFLGNNVSEILANKVGVTYGSELT